MEKQRPKLKYRMASELIAVRYRHKQPGTIYRLRVGLTEALSLVLPQLGVCYGGADIRSSHLNDAMEYDAVARRLHSTGGRHEI
jgi:hypothetical protein